MFNFDLDLFEDDYSNILICLIFLFGFVKETICTKPNLFNSKLFSLLLFPAFLNEDTSLPKPDISNAALMSSNRALADCGWGDDRLPDYVVYYHSVASNLGRVLLSDAYSVYPMHIRIKTVFNAYLKAAELGHPLSQLKVGGMTDPDPRKGLMDVNATSSRYWYQKAADQGCPEAMFHLGWLLLKGFHDYEGACKWFIEAGRHGVYSKEVSDTVLVMRRRGVNCLADVTSNSQAALALGEQQIIFSG